nr:metallophosphoesterase [uncultured Enterobacter sp.]
MIIAQISDIHAAPDNDNLARFDRALAWLDTLAPDVLVISGDLIDDGQSDCYPPIAARLATKPWPVYVLPGNADDRAAMRVHFASQQVADDALHFVHDVGALRLIGLDSTIEGSAAGLVTQHLAWLDRALLAPGPTTSILFLHHHVVACGIPPIDAAMCLDAAALGAFLQQHPQPPAALASGHVHRPMSGNLAGIPSLICGSVCPANPLWFGDARVPPVTDAPSLMIHRFNDGVLTHHVVSL